MNDDNSRREPGIIPRFRFLETMQWYWIIILLAGILAFYGILAAPKYREAFDFLVAGLRLTIIIALACFVIAVFLGLVAGLGRVSSNPVIYTIASLYVGIVRGIPMLVLILYIAFVAVPLAISVLNMVGGFLLNLSTGWASLSNFATSMENLSIRDVGTTFRGIIALAFSYGAFEAEVYRAGIESISKGQMEAARSLGMSYWQAMRHIIIPQALRVVLPPMANDFIAMVKDTSLVSVLGVSELTQLGKLHRATTFRTYEIWNTVAFLYLALTLLLQLLANYIARRMSEE
jgi:polar amino acid transport system permease protein